MKKLISCLTALALMATSVFGPFAPSVHAEESKTEELPATWLQLSPTDITVTLKGGDVLSGNSDLCPEALDAGCAVEVKNIGSQPFRYRLYAAPYNVKGENYDLNFTEGTSYTQITRWMKFLSAEGTYENEVQYDINPGETQLVYYRIEVPEDVPGGAQYAVIFAQTVGNGAASSSSIQTYSQVGVRVVGRSIGNTRRTAEVTDYGFQRFTFGGKLEAHAAIKNTGNTDFEANCYYTARTLFGKELYSDTKSLVAYPDTEYHVDIEWENTPFVGIFTVEFKVVGADVDRTETHIVVVMPIFIMILLILLLTIIIAWIIIIIRKRKERKARTLV